MKYIIIFIISFFFSDSSFCMFSGKNEEGTLKRRGKPSNLLLKHREKEEPLFRQLSHTSQSVRQWLDGDVKMAEIFGNAPECMDLSEESIESVSVPDEQGHRLTVKVKVKNSDCIIVLKITNVTCEELVQSYEGDLSLVTYQQASQDVFSFFWMRDKLKKFFSDRVMLPETRIAILNGAEFLFWLKKCDKENALFPFLRGCGNEGCYIFSVVQDFIGDLRKVKPEEVTEDKFADIIRFLHGHLKDTGGGNNIYVHEKEDKICLFDVEMDTVQWGKDALDYTEVSQAMCDPSHCRYKWLQTMFDHLPYVIYKPIERKEEPFFTPSGSSISSESPVDSAYATGTASESFEFFK